MPVEFAADTSSVSRPVDAPSRSRVFMALTVRHRETDEEKIMEKYHAEQLHNAIEHAKSLGQDFVTVSAGGMLSINIPIHNLRCLERQAEGWTRQAIRTRFHGPTNTMGTRVSAAWSGGRIYWDWRYGLSPEENHRAAAQALSEKLNWGAVVDGGSFDNDYYWLTAQSE